MGLERERGETPERIIGELRAGIDRERNFRWLFERYHRPVSCFFARRGFSEEDRRDLTQETFLGVYKGIGRFRQEARFETWLFEIAANIYRNALRSRAAGKRGAREISLEDVMENRGEIPDSRLFASGTLSERPLDSALERERTRLLRETLDELPPRMRRCVILRLDRDLNYQEIADLMKTSIETVKAQLHRARQRLRVRLSEYFEGFEL